MSVTHFPEKVSDKLQHYVYRLIDPRNGNTFYVGRGQGDRVFQHASGAEPTFALSQDEDLDDLKLRRVRAIKIAGFEVQHIIHRHGLTSEAAKEVESALIDAYAGPTNKVRGQDSSRGVQHAEQIMRLYQAEEAVFHHRVLLLSVNWSNEERALIDAARYAWNIQPRSAAQVDYVLAVARGLIIGAFVAERWLLATPENFPGFPVVEGQRFGFAGREAPEVSELYVQKRVPIKYRFYGGSVRYVDPEAEPQST